MSTGKELHTEAMKAWELYCKEIGINPAENESNQNAFIFGYAYGIRKSAALIKAFKWPVTDQ